MESDVMDVKCFFFGVSLAAKIQCLPDREQDDVRDCMGEGCFTAYMYMQRLRLGDEFNRMRLHMANVMHLDDEDAKALFMLGAAMAMGEPDDLTDHIGAFVSSIQAIYGQGVMVGAVSALIARLASGSECRDVVH